LRKFTDLSSTFGHGKRLSILLTLMTSILFLLPYGAFGQDDSEAEVIAEEAGAPPLRYDDEGNLITDDPGAKLATYFPQITGGFVVVIGEDSLITPTIGARYRLFPQIQNPANRTWIKWAQVIAPDFVELSAGATVIIIGTGTELIPEILTLTMGCGWTPDEPIERGLHFAIGFDILKF